ncbi:MAG: hypothetical protein Q8T03_10755 [Bacteroidota bacterium]|nr:hypothetical protein [Bacteroidota bacterium]
MLVAQKTSKQEKIWAFKHPFSAVKIKKLYRQVSPIYKQSLNKLLLDSFNNGGKLDAFRHTYFMAAFAQKVKVKKLRELGIAHEKGNQKQFIKQQTEEGELADSLSNVMDLNNNELGYKIGKENKNLSLEELRQLIIKEINEGKALIMKRNKSGNYLDCNNNIIDLKLYLHKWYVPKCLVSSDYIYKD